MLQRKRDDHEPSRGLADDVVSASPFKSGHMPSLNASSLSSARLYPGRLDEQALAATERPLVWLVSGLRVCPGAWLKAIGQAGWGTGVQSSVGRRAGVERGGPVMKVKARTAAQANAAAQIQLIWAKLDRNCAGSV